MWHVNSNPWLSPSGQLEYSMWHFLRFLLTFRYCQKYHVQLCAKLHRHKNIYYKTFVFREEYWAPGERGFYVPAFAVKDYAASQNVRWASLAKSFSLIFDVCLLLFVCSVLLLSVLFLVTTWLRGTRNKIRDFHLWVNGFILAQNTGTYVK